MSGLRIVAVAAGTLLLAFLVVGLARVSSYGSRMPAGAATWLGHPDITLEAGLAEVGDAAAAGRPIDASLVDRLVRAYSKAPLAPEPFLVRGVDAQLKGDARLAGQAFLAARDRNPREVAARYFLADHHLRTGETSAGLAEIAALARLLPQSLSSIAPYLAAHARSPGAAPEVKAVIRRYPQMELVLLTALAEDAGNLDLILYLWSGARGETAKAWQTRLLNSLVEAERYSEARTAWGRFTGSPIPTNQLLDPAFAMDALPPFGWTFISGAGGVAEPQGSGQLQINYYGRANQSLAKQLLTLRPGSYRLSMRVSGISPAAGSISWKLRCRPSSQLLASVPLDKTSRTASLQVPFTVPRSGCPAQLLELAGTADEFPAEANATIGRLELERVGGR